jgi:hypothetical protein
MGPTQSQINAAKRNSTGGGRKRCTKGKNCSATCIDPREMCLVELPDGVAIVIPKVTKVINSLKNKSSDTLQEQRGKSEGGVKPVARGVRQDEELSEQNKILQKIGDLKGYAGLKTTLEENKKIANLVKENDQSGAYKVLYNIEGVTLTKKVGNNDVTFSVSKPSGGGIEIGYTVNDSYNYGKITDRKEQIQAAFVVKGMFDTVTRSLEPGTEIETYAWSEDGKGEVRRKAYEKLGFSRVGGDLMAGVVKPGGGVSPYGEEEEQDYTEEIDNDVSLWYSVLFGKSINFKEAT